jgi:hypothetical protein
MTNNAINSSIPIEVTKGGTQASSFVAYAPVVGGTTSTGALQSVASAGNAGQFLVSGGPSALPTWQTGGGGGGFTSINIKFFFDSGTYTPSANLIQAVVILTAAGGGGGAVSGITSIHRGAGGGGGGETRIGSFSAATIGASQTITLGNGGTSGNNGQASTFGSLMTSNGGAAGQSVTGNTTPINALGGNTGGGGSGGEISITSYIGGRETGGNPSGITGSAIGGTGSISYWSYGGPGGFSDSVQLGQNGQSGDRGGGGGGGAASNGGSAVGGPGGKGFCVVYEYIG